MFSRRDYLSHHPTSMQSLVSSSTGTAAASTNQPPGSNSGRQSRQDSEAVYCGLVEPIGEPTTTAAAAASAAPSRHCQHRRHCHSHGGQRHWRHVGRTLGARAKRVGCLRSALLVAFVLILLGVIVTSSYAIDRRFSQIPQLLYTGLGLCSLGLVVIVVSVSVLVTGQLRKHGRRSAAEAGDSGTAQGAYPRVGRSRRGRETGQVPIWFIGCHRGTATAYCPPVPPSYWDATAAHATTAVAAAASAPKPLQTQPPPPPLPPPPPPQQLQPRSQQPLPPPPPPSYQEALRCLEAGSSRYRHHQSQERLGGCDQMSVLKWTVQSSQFHHQQQQQQLQRSQNLQMLHQLRVADSGAGVRRCESSSFIGEPILV